MYRRCKGADSSCLSGANARIAGYTLIEVICVLLAASILIMGLLQLHQWLKEAGQREVSAWQAHNRALMASTIMEKELRMAGFRGGWHPKDTLEYLPAVEGGKGALKCGSLHHASSTGCFIGGVDSFSIQSEGENETLIIRYWRSREESYSYQLPMVILPDWMTNNHLLQNSLQRLSHHLFYSYVTGFYIQKSGLYQHVGSQKHAQEVVRGITGLKCSYLEENQASEETMTFRDSEDVDDWQNIVAVRCAVTAESDPISLRHTPSFRASTTRTFHVDLRNVLIRHQGEKAYLEWKKR